MACPQVENGYIKIANELFDALIAYRIPGEQRQCLDCIFRKTYGYNKKRDAISLTQFMKMTGLKKPNICRAISGLLSKKIITIIKKDNEPAKVYEIVKDFTKWAPLSKKITVIKKDNLPLSFLSTTKDNVTKDNILDLKKSRKHQPFYETKSKKKLTGKRLESFNLFWDAFAYKNGKADAAEAWYQIPELTNKLVAKIVNAAKKEALRRPEIIANKGIPKMAQGWLSSKRWEDERYQSPKIVSTITVNPDDRC